MNHPHRNTIAENKPLQLTTVAEYGPTIPSIFITNDPEAARDFLTAQEDGAIYKPLQGFPNKMKGEPVALYASPVTPQEITNGVARTAHLFRFRIPKEFKVRPIVVGEHQFTARIDAFSEKARVDWRVDYDNLTHRPVSVPQSITEGMHRLMVSLGLTYGALDFIVDPDGC